MKWISVKNRLPEFGQYVLFCEKSQLHTYHMGWRDDPKTLTQPIWKNWFSESGEWFYTRNISHWQPLPQPPTT